MLDHAINQVKLYLLICQLAREKDMGDYRQKRSCLRDLVCSVYWEQKIPNSRQIEKAYKRLVKLPNLKVALLVLYRENRMLRPSWVQTRPIQLESACSIHYAVATWAAVVALRQSTRLQSKTLEVVGSNPASCWAFFLSSQS